MVVAAHPDDEILGCGATVHKLVGQHWDAHLVILTGGVGGRAASAQGTSDQVRGQQLGLRGETQQAAAVIGFAKIDTFEFPDNRMDTVSRMDLVHAIRPIIERERPDLVLTHHPGDYNWDHTLTFDAVMMAARCNPPEFSPGEIRTFEVLSSTERAWQEPARAFFPNHYVDVHASMDAKKLAMSYYRSECRPYPHPRSVEAIEYLARRRGNECGLLYAEAFHSVRKVEL
jgi:LmbE family N-acetylglucosaminyl deacetylase